MALIFITGSADGLGQLAARALVEQGHAVVLHARNAERGRHAMQQAPGAAGVLTGDLSDIEQTQDVARQANALGHFDAVIHNAGVFRAAPGDILRVNTLAPYILTCLIARPRRLVYLSSDMHRHGQANLEGIRPGGGVSYSDSKLHVVLLSMAVAREWPDVCANAVDPGWVPTRMGGRGAPDDLQQGYETQAWLAAGDDSGARVSGRYFFHQKESRFNPLARDVALQERFLRRCADVAGVAFPK